MTALEQVSSCYSDAVKKSGNASTLACFTKPGGAQSTLETASKSILEQFVGVLPASLTTAVENILTYNLANSSSSSSADAKLAGQVSAQISNAITSVSSALSGNTVTLAETLQACASELVASEHDIHCSFFLVPSSTTSGKEEKKTGLTGSSILGFFSFCLLRLVPAGNATRAEECIKSSRAPEMSQTTMLSIAQQFEGYLPSSFFSDLVEYSTPFIENYTANAHGLTQGQLNAELEKFFNNQTEYGAKYVTCLSQVQQCVSFLYLPPPSGSLSPSHWKLTRGNSN